MKSKRYKKQQILDLINLAKNGNEDAKLEIIERYMPNILKCIEKIEDKAYLKDELTQIGYITILEVINDYNEKRDKYFSTYLNNKYNRNVYYFLRDNPTELNLNDIKDEIFNTKTTMEEYVADMYDIKLIQEKIKTLSLARRLLLEGYYNFNGESKSSVALSKKFNISRGRCNVKINTSIEAIKKLLEEDGISTSKEEFNRKKHK